MEYNAEQSLDRVNSWINNCDQKAGYLLAMVGVIIAILFSSDFALQMKECIIKPFISYWHGQELYEFCLVRLIFFILALASLSLSFVISWYALLTITATCTSDDIQAENPDLMTDSRIFWRSISDMTYSKFSSPKSEYTYDDDLKNQIYINSIICGKKFKRYNLACKMFKWLLPCLFATYISFLFI